MADTEKEIVVTFDWDGKGVHKETFGFDGKACVEETAFVEEALKGRNQKRKFKAEYLKAKRLKIEQRIKA
jgi:hypothetical protein